MTRTPTQPSRQPFARAMRIALAGGVILLVMGVIILGVEGMQPAPLAAFSGAAICLAGVLGIIFQGMDKWARDSKDPLPRKWFAFLLTLTIVSIALMFWSTSL